MLLKGKVSIITGAASGIGKATAILFCQEGAKVVIADVDSEKGMAFENALKEKDFEAFFVKTDVRHPAEVESMVRLTVKHFERVDLLVNNAGVAQVVPVADLPEEDWDRVVDTNLKGVYLCCKYTIPEMMNAGGGSIINVASVWGIVGRPRGSAYNAAKAGVILLTKNMALDYARYNIRVNAVCPGIVETDLVMRYVKSSEDPQKTYEQFVNLHPIGRLGKPEEIAHSILFLASDKSSFITGSSLVIDGGYSAQ